MVVSSNRLIRLLDPLRYIFVDLLFFRYFKLTSGDITVISALGESNRKGVSRTIVVRNTDFFDKSLGKNLLIRSPVKRNIAIEFLMIEICMFLGHVVQSDRVLLWCRRIRKVNFKSKRVIMLIMLVVVNGLGFAFIVSANKPHMWVASYYQYETS